MNATWKCDRPGAWSLLVGGRLMVGCALQHPSNGLWLWYGAPDTGIALTLRNAKKFVEAAYKREAR